MVAGQVAAEAGPEAAPDVLYAGCATVLAGPICAREPGATLRLWAAVHRDATLVLELDGAAVAVDWTAAEDGLRAAVVPAAEATRVVLRDADAGWRWQLGLAAASEPPAELRAIAGLAEAERYAEAAAAVEAALGRLRGADRVMGLKLGLDIEYGRGAMEAAVAAAERVFAAAVAEEMFEVASDAALMASFVCSAYLVDFTGARGWLDRQAVLLPQLSSGRLHRGEYVALLAERTGDFRMALREYSEQVRVTRALGLNVELAAALAGLGVLRGRLGDTEGAEAAFAELFGLAGLAADTVARAQISASWVALMARARGQAAADPEPLLTLALAHFTAHADRLALAEVRLNLAYAALLRGDPAAARAALDRVEPATRANHWWRLYLDGRIAAAEGRSEAALRRFEGLIGEAEAIGDRALAWSAGVGAGEALEAMGRVDAAIGRYRAAAALHAASLASVAIDAGRERYAAEGDRAAQRLVRLLVRSGRADEAVCAARRARVQAFAGLAATTRDPQALVRLRMARDEMAAEVERTWDLPKRAAEQRRARLRARARRLDEELDEALAGMGSLSEGTGESCAGLRGPGPGEVVLVYFPVEAGYVGFAVDERGVVAAELPAELEIDPEARGRQLLGPFEAVLARAMRVRVVASGGLSGEAFHALGWGGRPLVDRVAVAYSLDLPGEQAAGTRPRQVVQLAPPSNLDGARDELAVAEQLRARGLVVTRLVGDEVDLRSRIGATDLLHYVGHARGDGWGSALDLGGGRALVPGDLLGGSAPMLAVLSGCETGLLDPRAHAGGMSLAHALLLAGSQAVLASDAKVDDELSVALTSAVLVGLADGEDPAEALRRVQRTLFTTRPDWPRFRMFVR